MSEPVWVALADRADQAYREGQRLARLAEAKRCKQIDPVSGARCTLDAGHQPSGCSTYEQHR